MRKVNQGLPQMPGRYTQTGRICEVFVCFCPANTQPCSTELECGICAGALEETGLCSPQLIPWGFRI